MSRLPRQTSIVTVSAYEDGLILKALLTVPSEEVASNSEDRGPVVLLATATAVPCRFYLPYLCFLVKNHLIFTYIIKNILF